MTSANIERSSSDPDWLLSILTESSQQEALESQRKPQIHKVPAMIRGISKHRESFDPMVVSFGPYHHGNPKLAMVEKLKIKIAKKLVMGRDLEEFYKFDEVARDARDYYDEESTARFTDEEFARMMFLDSCLLLYSIDCIVKNNPSDDTKIKNNQLAYISRDIFLLENQIPFVALQALMSLKIPGDEGEELVHKFIEKQTGSWRSCHCSENQDRYQPPHLLHLLLKAIAGSAPQQKSSQEFDNWHSFRSVTELRAGGIECKKSSNSSLKNVSFEIQRFHGDLFLPPIVVDDNTKSTFLNLVAYEACPDFANDYVVTSYVCFMDALIDHAEDVKELRSKGILLNLLGSDEKVADLFNDLATNLVPNPNEFLEVKGSIEKYYKKKRVIWMTEMLETHFRNPWTALGFLIAMVIILLTFVQSYFSIFPRGGGDEKAKSPVGRKFAWKD